MKKNILTIAAFTLNCLFAFAQTAGEVLENGIHIKKGEKIFLLFDNKTLKFAAAKSLHDPTSSLDYTLLEDSIILLPSKNGLNIYLNPLNPLNYSYTTETKILPDAINDAAATALGSITALLKQNENIPVLTKNISNGTEAVSIVKTEFDTCENFSSIKSALEDIQTRLRKNQKEAIIAIFTSLKNLSFNDEATTQSEIDRIEKAKKVVELYFSRTDSLLDLVKSKIDIYTASCNTSNGFIVKYIFNSFYKDLTIVKGEQAKRLESLQAAYNLVKKVQIIASAGEGSAALKWSVKLGEVPSREGKISVNSITVKESGYKLSDKNEIISTETKEIVKRTLRVRKFQQFVPEVSVGTAYTFFKYNTYGTTSDSAGIKTHNLYIASPTKNSVRNLNITTMVNFNCFIPNSTLHPLYQIGVAVNSGVPTFVTGFGIRSNINGVRRLAISGGIALTWLKELDKLKVGDRISGTDAIEKDLKFQFSWPPKAYIGLQYNF